MEVHIKLCNLRHIDAAVDLFEQYRQFYGMPADYDGAHKFLNDRLRNNDSVFLLAVDEEDRPLGFTQLYPMFSSTRMMELWVLNDLFVLQEARHMGVGRRLMNAARHWASHRNVKVLALSTQKENASAKRLYESLGYELDTEFDHYELTLA